MGSNIAEGRHPSVESIAQFFDHSHLSGVPKEISSHCSDLAMKMLRDVKDSLELATGLRKLLEAKDCFVRASLIK